VTGITDFCVAEFLSLNICAKIAFWIHAASFEAWVGGVSVALIQKKSGNGVEWIVGCVGSTAAQEGNTGSLDCAGSFAGANDPASLGMTGDRSRAVIPWIFASADPNEKWWVRLRGNPKRSGEISQAAFLLKAETMGFDVALPWGDNQKFDFVVWRGNGRAMRVQVKGTGRLHRRGYEVQPVHATRHGGKKRYSKKDIDLIAAHVQPVDAWYLIPIEKVGRAKSLRLYPGIRKRVKAPRLREAQGRLLLKSRRVGYTTRKWERWRDRWDLLGK
jgi:hypothetical protein